MKQTCKYHVVVIALWALVVQGCMVATKDTIISPNIVSMFQGVEYTVSDHMKKEKDKIKSVAVLPFVNKAASQRGSEEVRRGFYNHFSSLPFTDMQLFRVDSMLRKADLTDPLVISKKTPQELGKILGVDAVVYGEISDFDKLFLVAYSQVAVGAEIKIYDTKTGNLLWSGKHTARIHEGGLSTNPIGMIAVVVTASLNMRDIQLLRACDDLFRDMVKTIPTPSIAEALQPPVITLLTQDTKNLPKKAGDEIKVVIQGAPKMLASFDIGDFKKQLDMKEMESGWYLGVYKVVPGDNVRNAIITGRLSFPSDPGNFSEWVDALGTVTLKTTPPDKPQNATTVGRNQIVLLSWGKSSDPDLIGYRVYRSMTPLSGFQEIAKTEFTELRDQGPGLVNAQKYYYLISAVDRAGNESDKTGPIAGMPVAPGPTPVAGIIEADTVWYSGASPYIIENTVAVKDKATLTIEPGTEIKSKGGALVIEGRLVAQGDGEHVITFDAVEEGKIWKGIVFSNVKEKENVLRFARVKNAQEAIDCQASSPRIEACEFMDNKTALKITGAFSKPQITKSVIHKSKEAAVVIADGAQPTLTDNRIQDNDKAGILVRTASPMIIHNSISQNRGTGISLRGSHAAISENNLTDNKPFNMEADMKGEAVNALNNWWGSSKGIEVLSTIRGKIGIAFVLNAPYPTGKPLALPILPQTLGDSVSADSFLILSFSPYRVAKDLTITGGATLYIEPGVEIQFDQNTAIVAEDGGVIAKGTKEYPILFTASAASPTPGVYTSAVKFLKDTKVNSAFAYCVVRYADIAFDIHQGAPEISYSYVANNAQSGIYCRNQSAASISFNTFSQNRGEGAITCVGNSRPRIFNNNFVSNDFAIQARSTIYVDARNNWWGKSPPDLRMIFGDLDTNLNIKPWLTAPEEKAFKP